MAIRGVRMMIGAALALLGLVMWGGYQVVRGFGQGHFPDLPVGLYAGSLECDDGRCSRPFLVERQPELRELAVFVGDERVPAQRAVTRDPSGRTGLPLVLSADTMRLKLAGEARGVERYQGTFVDPVNSVKGRWTLERVRSEGLDVAYQKALSEWYVTWAGLQVAEAKIAELRKAYDEQTRKIEKLNGSLLDDDTLRRKADDRLDSASSALESAQAELGQVRQELEAALRNVELAQRVSSQGNLVSMSRESIQREARWIGLSLNLFAPEIAPGFEESLERAYRVQQLKDEIAHERQRLYDEGEKQRYGGESAETVSEEEFYREVR